MPTYQITGPDGKKYRITGDNPEGAMQALQQHLGSAPDFKQPIGASNIYVDEMLFGLPGKAAAAMNAAAQAPFSDETFGQIYGEQRHGYNQAREEYAQEHPIANEAATLGGGIMGVGKVLKGGKLAAEAVAPALLKKIESSILGRTATDAAGGAVVGGLSAYGHDQNVAGGAAAGALLGGAARPVVEAAGGLGNSLAGMVGLGNKGRARQAIYDALTRSGKTPDEVSDELGAAAADGQPQYMLADALGSSGQRMLSGIARAPGDMRQTIAETLQRRQGDQGRRISNALQEASGSQLTAEQTQQALRTARSEAAAKNYAPVESDITPIDVSSPVRRANWKISPAAETMAMHNKTLPTDIASRQGIEGGERALRDPIREAVRTARSYLASPTLTASNVEKAFRAKTNIDRMIATATERGQGEIVNALKPIRDDLDATLARTSENYAKARDAYSAQSGLIDAVDIGRNAGNGRQLSEDVLNQFGALPEPQQAPFRAGYFDPLIRRAETSAFGVDKSRPLITDAYAREFPAIAAPGKADQLSRRLQREQRMFETRNMALGGSKTADNMADIGEMAAFDPTMIGHLATGNIKGAAIHALTRGAQAISGRNQQTRDMIARALLQSSPTKANAEIASAIEAGKKLTATQQKIVNALIGASVPQVVSNF